MASSTAAKKCPCATCEKSTGIFTCGGCTRAFCTKHANEHRQMLGKQMDEIIFKHDQLRQNINEQKDEIAQCPSMKEIDEWERQSIEKISRAAENARQKLRQCLVERTQYIQTAVQELKDNLNKALIEDDFVETDLKLWSDKIKKLKTDMSTTLLIFINSPDDGLIRFVSPPDPQDDIEVQIDNTQVDSTNNATACLSTFVASEDYSHPRVIELSTTSEGLGLRLRGGREEDFPLYISRIIPNSVAWKHGGLKIGDQLLSINGVSVENEDHEKVFELIQQSSKWITLVVRSSPQVVIAMESLF